MFEWYMARFVLMGDTTTLQTYESWAINLHRRDNVLSHWKLCKSTIMVDMHIFLTNARQLLGTHMLVGK